MTLVEATWSPKKTSCRQAIVELGSEPVEAVPLIVDAPVEHHARWPRPRGTRIGTRKLECSGRQLGGGTPHDRGAVAVLLDGQRFLHDRHCALSSRPAHPLIGAVRMLGVALPMGRSGERPSWGTMGA